MQKVCLEKKKKKRSIDWTKLFKPIRDNDQEREWLVTTKGKGKE